MALLVILRASVNHNFKEVQAEIQTLPGRIDQAIYEGVVEATHIVAEAYRRTINYREHPGEHTRDTIEESPIERTGNTSTGHVGSDNQVAEWLEYGTPPHVIRASKGKVLHFFIDGREIFVTEVHHPGTPDYRPLLRATEESEQAVYKTIEDKVEAALGGIQ